MSQEEQFFHIPVLLSGVLEYLTFPTDRPVRLIDGTLGGAGHTSALLEKYPLDNTHHNNAGENALQTARKLNNKAVIRLIEEFLNDL